VRRVLVITLGWVLIVGPAGATQPVRGRPETARQYRHHLVTKRWLALAAGGSGINQARNVPHEWGRGWSGYAARFGSAFGEHLIKSTIEFGVATWHHEDPHYYRSDLHGTWPRLKYAVRTTFIVPRTNKPGKTVALSRFSGAFGAGMISRLWQPASTAGIGAGFASGGILLGADVGVHVAAEFWPRKSRGKRAIKRAARR
jgi:hypothetical protein